jgi:hypothetical protein
MLQSCELVDDETVPVPRCAPQGIVIEKVALFPKERTAKQRVAGWAILVFVIKVEAKTSARALPPCVSIRRCFVSLQVESHFSAR